MRLSTALLLAILAATTHHRDHVPLVVDAAPSVRYDCEPCLDRSRHTVRAIVHGSSTDPFWQQVRSSALQSAKDMDVNFRMDLASGTFNPSQMANEIKAVADNARNGITAEVPDALVVTIPTEDVKEAVQDAVSAGVPVFGLNSGDAAGKSVGVLDFVAPNNYEGGVAAAEEFQSLLSQSVGKVQTALFVNDEMGNVALDERLSGFEKTLSEATVTKLSVDGTDPASMAASLSNALKGCPYQAVLLSGTRSLPYAIEAYQSSGCTLSSNPLGAFDTSQEVFASIGNDALSFTVGQQQALQGALSVHLAALYASTGKTLALPVNGAYLSGPQLITKEDLPSDTLQVCEDDAWPVCPNTMAPDGQPSQCDCIERPKIKIGGVHHGVTTDSFWDPVYAASAQAAIDMGVELINDRPPPEEVEALLHEKMANAINRLCEQEGVHGIFVSIPSDAVLEAIQKCLDLEIPVISINAGADTSESMGLMHHIGQLEYNAGYGAGDFLAGRGISQAICINHAEGVNVVEERCAGFRDAVEKEGATYLGQVYVPDDNKAIYIDLVEEAVGNWTGDSNGDWEGIGILAAGGPQHIPVIALQARHDKALIGAFDTSSELYDAVDAGIKEFGIDQQPYLQGYMPVLLLTHAVSTGQSLSNQVIESGPAFVEASPSPAQVVCEETFFETCLGDEMDTKPTPFSTEGGEGGNPNTGLIVGLSIMAAALVFSFAFLAFRINKLDNHVKELQGQGKEIPRLSMGQKMSSIIRPVDDIVTHAERPEVA